MKKTLLVAALTVGFAGLAHAETSVTLYGIADAGIGYQKLSSNDGPDSKKIGLVDGIEAGNRWGLKGTEDLGNGLQAVFQLESGYSISNGTQGQFGTGTSERLFGRQATIGLKSAAWGQFDLGRQTNIASKYFAGVANPFGAGFSTAKTGTTFGAADTVRYDNMAMYQTPSFSGFQFGVGYSFDAAGSQIAKVSGEADRNDRAITTGLRYGNGPIAVALTYDNLKTANNAAGTLDTGTINAWNLGGSYDFEVVKLHLGVGQSRNGLFTGGGSAGNAGAIFYDGAKINSYTVGVSAPIGAGSLLASWGLADPKGSLSDDGAKKQQVYSLGYTYSLSKRTDLYALGSYVKNNAFEDGDKSTVAAVGIKHAF
mgnify:CR=1 FL=1